MSSYKIVVNTDHAGKVEHHYATESDARFQFSEWMGQNVDCELVITHPDTVFIAWETEVTERYRIRVNVTDLPQSVQDALAAGIPIANIDSHTDVEHFDTHADLWTFIADNEDNPYDEAVTGRELDLTAMDQEKDK